MQPVALNHASRLINHGPTVLVTSAHAGRRNVMAAAWSMPVEFTPPRVAVVIDKSTFTRELVLASGAFALCLPGRALADVTYTVGSTSGRDGDKFSRYGVQLATGVPGEAGPSSPSGPSSPTGESALTADSLGLPLVQGCVAWLVCRHLPEPGAEERYDTFYGEVVAAWADPRVFAQGRWSFTDDNTELHTLHHLGAGVFAWPGRTVQASVLA
jgi:flavin reductase (DIM6/NTAB) family NADH-FMN oxidoreductase RutF